MSNNLNLRTRGPHQRPSELMLQWLENDEYHDWTSLLDSLAAGTHASNPYHNMTHMLNVAWYALHIYRTEVRPEAWQPHNEAIIITASLLHDFDHSGGYHKNDKDNVAATLEYIESASGQPVLRHLGFDLADRQTIAELIACTVFDAATKTFPQEPENDMQKALRDADLMSLYSAEGHQLLVGLYYEIYGKPFTYASLAEAKAYARAQYDFNQSVRMYTSYGQRVQQHQFVRSARELLTALGNANYALGYAKVSDVIPELAIAIPESDPAEEVAEKMRVASLSGGPTLQ